MITPLSSNSLSVGVITFKRSLNAACEAGLSIVCASGVRGGRSSFDAAGACGGVVVLVVVAVVSLFGVSVPVVDLETEERIGANCGSGSPAAFASSAAASCASMRW